MLPALPASPQGGVYRLVDEGASVGRTHTYRLVEVEVSGQRRMYGPYECSVQGAGFGVQAEAEGGGPAASPAADREAAVPPSFTRTPHAPSELARARVAERERTRPRVSRREADKSRQAFTRSAGSGGPGTDMMKIGVTEKGVYGLTAVEIADCLGVTSGEVADMIAEKRLVMTSRGRAVAWLPRGGGLDFYGHGMDSIYTAQNIYWLEPTNTVGGGLCMQVVAGDGPDAVAGDQSFTSTVSFEEDHYAPTAMFDDPEGDFLVWDYLDSKHIEAVLPFAVEGVAAGSYTGSVAVYLKGGAVDPEVYSNHHVTVVLNGAPVGESRWHGTDEHKTVLPFDQSLLLEGSNELKLAWVLDSGVTSTRFYVDSFKVIYQRDYAADGNVLFLRGDGHAVVTVDDFTTPDIRVFDISDPLRPALIAATTVEPTGGTWRVSFSPALPDSEYVALTAPAVSIPDFAKGVSAPTLRSPANRADWVIVAPEEFLTVAQSLADYRTAKGLETMVVDLEKVFDAFNFGIVDPRAIRAFLGYAYRTWDKPPRYAVLAGEGSFDYKDFTGSGSCVVPPLMVSTPHGLFASDVPLGDVTGDGIPDTVVGRLPALFVDELWGTVGKILAHELGGDWKTRATFAADDPDKGGHFTGNSDAAALLVSAETEVHKVYLSEMSVGDAKTELIGQLNEGRGMMNYIGHAGLTAMAGEGLLRTSDLSSLNNSNRAPVVLAMSCIMGRYGIPGFDCLGEALLVNESGGAAAVWAPVGPTYNAESMRLDERALRTLFGEGKARIGDGIIAALAHYKETGRTPWLPVMYNLLGDPATAFGDPLSPPMPVNHAEHMLPGEWRRLMFAPLELTAGMGQGYADPDGDDILNDFEYTLVLDPRDGTRPAGFHVLHVDLDPQVQPADRRVQVNFVKREIAEDPAFIVEVCDDLATGDWQPVTGYIAVVDRIDVGEGLEEIVIEFEPPEDASGMLFARLRLSGP